MNLVKKLLLAFILTLFPLVCQAKYSGNTKYPEFFNNLHSSDGTYCCDESDGYPYYGNYTILNDGSVQIGDNQEIVPKGRIILNNPTGHAIWWYTDTSEGRHTYCFSPGTLS